MNIITSSNNSYLIISHISTPVYFFWVKLFIICWNFCLNWNILSLFLNENGSIGPFTCWANKFHQGLTHDWTEILWCHVNVGSEKIKAHMRKPAYRVMYLGLLASVSVELNPKWYPVAVSWDSMWHNHCIFYELLLQFCTCPSLTVTLERKHINKINLTMFRI